MSLSFQASFDTEKRKLEKFEKMKAKQLMAAVHSELKVLYISYRNWKEEERGGGEYVLKNYQRSKEHIQIRITELSIIILPDVIRLGKKKTGNGKA